MEIKQITCCMPFDCDLKLHAAVGVELVENHCDDHSVRGFGGKASRQLKDLLRGRSKCLIGTTRKEASALLYSKTTEWEGQEKLHREYQRLRS